MLNLRRLHPMQVMERALFLQSIKEIGPEKIIALDDAKLYHFLLEVENDKGETEYEIDWHFCIFEATPFQMNSLLENFIPKPKEEKSEEDIAAEIPPKGDLVTPEKEGPVKERIIIDTDQGKA